MDRIGFLMALLTSGAIGFGTGVWVARAGVARWYAEVGAWSGAPSELKAWWPHRPFLRWIARERACAHDRRVLASLDDRLLRDIGLDRAAVETESAAFWRWR
jgi:uncharacterized protein YjiS (DUF1127 family)